MYHTHNYSGTTSFSDDHKHDYEGVTSPSPTGVPHIHNIVGYTDFTDGHRHYYALQTSLDYQVPGGHIHYISGMTYITEAHYHFIKDSSGLQTPWHYVYPLYRYNFQKNNFYSQGISNAELMLSNKFRELWEQHTTWTRATIVSLVFGLPDVDFVTNRLLQNPEDFGNAFKVYYGDRIGSKLRDLIREHLVIAAQLVKAAKAGDTKAESEIEKRWYANGDEIAAFLDSINPYWSEEAWRKMYRTHLGLVKSEAVILLNKNYSAEASVYDNLETQALEMADMMIHGIIKQFPEKFK